LEFYGADVSGLCEKCADSASKTIVLASLLLCLFEAAAVGFYKTKVKKAIEKQYVASEPFEHPQGQPHGIFESHALRRVA